MNTHFPFATRFAMFHSHIKWMNVIKQFQTVASRGRNRDMNSTPIQKASRKGSQLTILGTDRFTGLTAL